VKVLDYENFAIHGFFIKYPISCKVELDPDSDWNKGNVVFKLPTGDRIFLSWGPIQTAIKKYRDLLTFANAGLDRIRKMQMVTKIEAVETESKKVYGHDTIFSHFKVQLGKPSLFSLFKRQETVLREIWTYHGFCHDSERYFIIYGISEMRNSVKLSEILRYMQASFRCHAPK